MTENLESIAQKLLDKAINAGAKHADTIMIKSDSVTVNVRTSKLEHVERAEGLEVGLRVLIGQKQACVSGSNMSTESFSTMAEQAIAMAQAAPDDPFSGLATSDQLATDTQCDDLELTDPSEPLSLEQLKDMATEAETSALAVKDVSQCESVAAGFGTDSICVAASNGFFGNYNRSSTSVSCAAIAGFGTGMEVDYCYESRVYASDLPRPTDIGRIAGERAAERLDSRRPPTGSYPVLFDERVSSSLIGHLLSAINGSAICRGSSWLLGALESQVLPDSLSIIEDPMLPRYQSSKPFDAEGLPTKRKNLVENGILKGWILDLSTARKLGLDSTGNASRSTTSVPSPTVTNIQLPDGKKSRDDLISDMETGLIITSLIGSTINPVTGDYSRGASGFWVENGKIIKPVSELTIAGNLKQFLKTIIPANDSCQFRRYRVPSLLVEGLTIAGA